MFPPELYIGLTIQSRSAACRAAQDLVYQNDYFTSFLRGRAKRLHEIHRGGLCRNDDYNITQGRRSLATLKSDYVIYEPSHTYLQKKKKQSSHILICRATSTCSQHLLLEAYHRRDQEIIPSDEEIPNYISLVGTHLSLLDEYCENILKM